ncbi:ammecr1 [Schizosaccharomyces cryophilus OY26]|uniref:Ammecr1 n=1 Tax=Schizosaccharomyces cryophilus (strain OY26 / ATCC MYA-4695 / CBS 11777 / NBRC 106824 / NRRL Y48691) TaxID=653667 RepID=S9W6C3_SCHCR|nr:ammecr1 [Schizosaccharomyces cryophilus OY26]EPY53365.1 ammecr1 [Schizosaccharomyces cryophilus OY26]
MEEKQYCYFCFEVVSATLEHRRIRNHADWKSWTDEVPLFVKFFFKQRLRKQLRGCIGTFQPRPLHVNLRYFSQQAAFHDDRFHPITVAELPFLECGIDLLVNFEPIDDPLDWVVGVHGLSIEFYVDRIRYSATYLPSVAAEQGWTQKETLLSLIRKSGFYGIPRNLKIQATRYQSSQVECSFEEYFKIVNRL